MQDGVSGYEQVWRDQIRALNGTEFYFGTIRYRAFADDSFSLQLEPLTLLPDLKLSIEWTDNFNDIRYRLSSVSSRVETQYRYTNLESKQRLAVREDSESEGRSSLELTSSATTPDEFLLSATINDKTLLGRADGMRAQFSLTDQQLSNHEILQESFNLAGVVVEASECVYTEASAACDNYWPVEFFPESGSLIVPSSGDTDPGAGGGEFGEGESENMEPGSSDVSGPGSDQTQSGGEAIAVSNTMYSHFNEITVRNLPDSVEIFDIVSDSGQFPDGEFEFYCSGWQVAFADFVEVTCFVDSETALRGAVIAFDEFGNYRELPDVEIVYLGEP